MKVLTTRLTLGVLHAIVREWIARNHYRSLTCMSLYFYRCLSLPLFPSISSSLRSFLPSSLTPYLSPSPSLSLCLCLSLSLCLSFSLYLHLCHPLSLSLSLSRSLASPLPLSLLRISINYILIYKSLHCEEITRIPSGRYNCNIANVNSRLDMLIRR